MEITNASSSSARRVAPRRRRALTVGLPSSQAVVVAARLAWSAETVEEALARCGRASLTSDKAELCIVYMAQANTMLDAQDSREFTRWIGPSRC